MAIGVDIEALVQAAARVDGIAGNFQAELDKLGGIVAETGNYMQGGPQEAFEAKYGEFKTSLTNFIGALGVYSKAMKAYAEDTRQATTVGAQRFNSI